MSARLVPPPCRHVVGVVRQSAQEFEHVCRDFFVQALAKYRITARFGFHNTSTVRNRVPVAGVLAHGPESCSCCQVTDSGPKVKTPALCRDTSPERHDTSKRYDHAILETVPDAVRPVPPFLLFGI